MKLIYTFLVISAILIGMISVAQVNKHFAKSNDDKVAIIKVNWKDGIVEDTLRLVRYSYYFGNGVSKDETISSTKDRNDNYVFKLGHITQPLYFSLYSHLSSTGFPLYLLNLYVIEAGDNVQVTIRKTKTTQFSTNRFVNYQPGYSFIFSGRGAAKYQCRYEAEQQILLQSRVPEISKLPNYLFSDVQYGEISKSIINKFSKQISLLSLNILRLDLLSLYELDKLFWMSTIGTSLLKDTVRSKEIWKKYQLRIDSIDDHFAQKIKTISIYYSQLIVEKSLLESRSGNNNAWLVYNNLKQLTEGQPRDQIITSFVLSTTNNVFGEKILSDALQTITTDYCLEQLQSYSESNSKGKQAYNFSLVDVNGNLVKLSDFKNKVVFIDFWFTGCAACYGYYLNTLSKVEAEFKDNPEIKFITINVDIDKNTWINSIDSKKYTSMESINLNTGGKGLTDPVIEKFRVFSFPRPLLIDRKGKIFNNHSNELRQSPDKLIDIIKEALSE
jgi:thiol-disulfide isomerase/thioredoxin